MAEATATKVKAEVTSIFVEPYPNVKGKMAESKKYSPAINDVGDKYRYDFQIPIPTTDDEAKKYYNLSLVQLIEKGTVQHAYNETVITGMLKDRFAAGKSMDNEKFVASLANALKTALIWTPRESKASEAKVAKDTVAELFRDYGLDPNKSSQADLMNAIRESRKAK